MSWPSSFTIEMIGAAIAIFTFLATRQIEALLREVKALRLQVGDLESRLADNLPEIRHNSKILTNAVWAIAKQKGVVQNLGDD